MAVLSNYYWAAKAQKRARTSVEAQSPRGFFAHIRHATQATFEEASKLSHFLGAFKLLLSAFFWNGSVRLTSHSFQSPRENAFALGA